MAEDSTPHTREQLVSSIPVAETLKAGLELALEEIRPEQREAVTPALKSCLSTLDAVFTNLGKMVDQVEGYKAQLNLLDVQARLVGAGSRD